MRFDWLPLTVLILTCASAQAQIYTCRAPDGTRVFSDERCGPDAKLVPGVASKKRSTVSTSSTSKPVSAPAKTATELQALLAQCDTGDVAACNAWTRGGGPNQLREKERQAQLACEKGSLPACEERYCSDGASSQCHARVMQTATMSGSTWYLRNEARQQPDGTARYGIRCIWEGARDTRDVSISCVAKAGPQRCSDAGPERAFARLDAAASSYCARK